MADSSTTSSKRQSSRIAKRLKTEPSNTGNTDRNSANKSVPVASKKQKKQTTSNTNVTKHPPSLTPASLRSTGIYENISTPLECDFILNEIFSFVGDFQYLFIGSVNRSFEKSNAALFPTKKTKFNASTIEHTKFCWDEICKCKDVEKKEEQQCQLYESAARYGKIDVLKYLLKLLPSAFKKNYWMHNICDTAAKYGHIEVLQWAYDENILSKDNSMICHIAIAHGHIDMFQWAIKNGFSFEEHHLAAHDACRNGQLEALKFLIDNDYEIEFGGRNDESLKYINSAACKGQLDVMIWLHHKYGAEFDDDTLVNALASGHVPTVEFLLESNCELNIHEGLCSFAAFFGPLAMLQLLRSNDIEWDENAIIEKAAEGGHLDIVKWAHENGCPLTKSACQYAAGFGHLETLKGLRAMGCPWDEDTTTFALTAEIYYWAKMNGCPVAKGNPRDTLECSFVFCEEWY